MLAGIGEKKVADAIEEAIGDERHWVLFGGPPCQSFSNANQNFSAQGQGESKEDVRAKLWKNFVEIIANHRPSVFLMESVRGLLKAKNDDKKPVFDEIISNMKEPGASPGRKGLKKNKTSYRLFGLVSGKQFTGDGNDFLVKAEECGVPQARHRVFILGVREDLGMENLPKALEVKKEVNLSEVIDDLLKLRSRLSQKQGHVDGAEEWANFIKTAKDSSWFKHPRTVDSELKQILEETLSSIDLHTDRGGDYVRSNKEPKALKHWFLSKGFRGAFNHETRGHTVSDLHRYLFIACKAKLTGEKSPAISDFPDELMPDHKSAKEGTSFLDRFRVQMPNRP